MHQLLEARINFILVTTAKIFFNFYKESFTTFRHIHHKFSRNVWCANETTWWPCDDSLELFFEIFNENWLIVWRFLSVKWVYVLWLKQESQGFDFSIARCSDERSTGTPCKPSTARLIHPKILNYFHDAQSCEIIILFKALVSGMFSTNDKKTLSVSILWRYVS